MPEPEEQPAPPPAADPGKTLVLLSDGHYYVMFTNGITPPKKLTPAEENDIKDGLVTATGRLTDYFNQPGHDSSLASGVRIRLADHF